MMTDPCPLAHAMIARICVPDEGVSAAAVAPTPPPFLPDMHYGTTGLFGAICCLTIVVVGAWIATRRK